jgi:hypothetical protein
VSITVRDEELEVGIRRLLRGQSYILTHTSAPAAEAPRITEIVVLGMRAPRDAQVMSGAGPVAERPLEQGAQARRRGGHVERRSSGEGPAELDAEIHAALRIALKDPDETVRAAALGQMRLPGGLPSLRLLGRVAHEDASPSLRIQALDLLAERSGARGRTFIQHALWDPDEGVREHALRLLEQVGGADRGR